MKETPKMIPHPQILFRSGPYACDFSFIFIMLLDSEGTIEKVLLEHSDVGVTSGLWYLTESTRCLRSKQQQQQQDFT